MNPACLHCHVRFEGNDVIEAFPFARRVAYDPVKLRYWVVCHRCGKWSMAPMEDDERGNTVDQLERWWRGSTHHYSTGGIGVGRYSERFSVVRIGDATWPEFAFWRFGETIQRRKWRWYRDLAVLLGAGAAVAGTGLMSLASLSTTLAVLVIARQTYRPLIGTWRGVVCRVPAANAERPLMRITHLGVMELERRPSGLTVKAAHDRGVVRLTGEEAIRLLGFALSWMNLYGASRTDVATALSHIDDAGGPEAMAEQGVATPRANGSVETLLMHYPVSLRVALEMATREHTERRALENELALLRAEWQEAEEIATIASRLTLPTPR